MVFHPRGDLDVLWRTGRRSGLPLQSLADEHIYVLKYGADDMGGQIVGVEDTYRTLHRCGTRGSGIQVLRHPGPQAVILIWWGYEVGATGGRG